MNTEEAWKEKKEETPEEELSPLELELKKRKRRSPP